MSDQRVVSVHVHLVDHRLEVTTEAVKACPLAAALQVMVRSQIRALQHALITTRAISRGAANRELLMATPPEIQPKALATDQNIVMRPSVFQFGLAMERTLRKHDPFKGGQLKWRNLSQDELMTNLLVETDELEAAFEEGDPLRIAAEAVDVANCAMILLDRVQGLPDDPPVMADASPASSTGANS